MFTVQNYLDITIPWNCNEKKIFLFLFHEIFHGIFFVRKAHKLFLKGDEKISSFHSFFFSMDEKAKKFIDSLDTGTALHPLD